jgi:2-oxoglutarate dehydrogenase E2 component (dihydrolipoamide succinyltransferase)
MAVEIKVPSLGESITEARVLRWLKQDGEYAAVDEPVVEIETDKASDSIPAPAAGIVRTAAKPDQTVRVGAVIGRIEPGAPPANAKAPARQATPAPAAPTPAAPAPKPAPTPSIEKSLSPAAQRIVAERGLDVANLEGTGRDGRIIKEDVLEQKAPVPPAKREPSPAASDTRHPIPDTPAKPRERRERMSTIRQRIAERLVQSQHTTATLTTFNEADMSAITDLRARVKDRFKERHGVGLGFMSFFVKAAVAALKAFPAVNARIDGAEVVYQNFYDLGVAVSTERGLMVPVLRDADRLGFAEIEKKIAELAGLARDGKISTAHLQGGTFTITNGGVFGSLLSTPILNPPQCAILGMHTIQKRPVVVNDQIAIRPMMYLALSYDHRLIDGRDAVQFLVAVKDCVENPGRLLLDI